MRPYPSVTAALIAAVIAGLISIVLPKSAHAQSALTRQAATRSEREHWSAANSFGKQSIRARHRRVGRTLKLTFDTTWTIAQPIRVASLMRGSIPTVTTPRHGVVTQAELQIQ